MTISRTNIPREIKMAKKKKDKKWIQKVNKSIKKRGTKGKCTPITKTFKKMANNKKRKKG